MARDRYRSDSAGVGPDPSLTGSLTRLSDMRGYKVVAGGPDIRGWDVRTLSGSEVGEVDDLLIDPHRGEVVLIDIDLKGSDQHVNVPIRGVQLDRARNCVIVDSGDIRSARDSVPVYGEDRAVEARPIVEEVVVRRRVIDPDEAIDRDEVIVRDEVIDRDALDEKE
ncbi:MAG: PRC-barrel domain-containing protein [Gemmatimonadota bacterium]